MGKSIKKHLKNEILEKIKNEGLAVKEASELYNVHIRTIYGWLNKELDQGVSILKFNKLKKENGDLYKIIGKLTVALKKEGKN
jgi:transposase